jgi:catechol 2,3-dioxygenase-like lactoylglutathione lyase family enzyme
MIHRLDHVTLAAASPADALNRYAQLLGQSVPATDAEPPRLATANTDLKFVPKTPDQAEGIAGLCFAVQDLSKARNLLERRGMRVLEAGAEGSDAKSLLVATDSTHGVVISLAERAPRQERQAGAAPAAAALDHVVIRTPNPERAVALYAGRLGLSLRLDRSEPSWGARLLFFRCGDLVIEVAHDLKAGVGDGNDSLWGLSWRVDNIAVAHARLKDAGVEVSDVRAGRRPGSKVFTVRSQTAGVPTIMIGLTG